MQLDGQMDRLAKQHFVDEDVEVDIHIARDVVSQNHEPSFPVQVNFYFWLDNFLDLCAQENYAGAQESLDEWREDPSLACRPRWEEHKGADSLRNREAILGTIENGGSLQGRDEDVQADQCRRCLAAYAGAVHEYMGQTKRNLAFVEGDDCEDNSGFNVAAPSWKVCSLPEKGRTMVATRQIEAGEEIEVQRPIAFLQVEASALVCPHCLRTHGTATAQWSQLPGVGRASLPQAACKAADDLSKHVESGTPTKCTNGDTCMLVFCSASCEARAQRGHHGLLCCDVLNEEQGGSYDAILDIATRHEGKYILLALQLLAAMLAEARSYEAMGHRSVLHGIVESYVGKYRSEPWEQLATGEARVQRECDLKAFAEHAENLLGPFCDVLCDAGAAQELLFSPKAMSACIGMLELVCIKATLCSPLSLALSAACGNVEACATKNAFVEEVDDDTRSIAEFAETSTGRRLSRPVCAAAFVNFVSFLNHSCIPNVEVDFANDKSEAGPGLWCIIIATRTIAKGEELNMQYIPVVATPFEERQQVLEQGWLFTCTCTRCTAEQLFSESDSTWFCLGSEAFRDGDNISNDQSDHDSDGALSDGQVEIW